MLVCGWWFLTGSPNRSARARATSRSSRQGSGGREQDQDVTAAARRDVGETPAAESRHEARDGVRLVADLGCGITGGAAAGEVEVERQHPASGRAGGAAGIRQKGAAG
jgi:hypothetical protein